MPRRSAKSAQVRPGKVDQFDYLVGRQQKTTFKNLFRLIAVRATVIESGY